MFYPESLVPLTEVQSACRNMAWDRFHDPASHDPFDMKIDPRIELYTELLLSRFLEMHHSELFAFQFPDIVLKVSSLVLFQDRYYDAPCPETVEEAESALDHLKRGPRCFLTDAFRVTAEVPKEAMEIYGLHEAVEMAGQMSGALICWKPKQPTDSLEPVLRRFVDHVYWRESPHYSKPFLSDDAQSGLLKTWQDYSEVCPEGKDASGLTWGEIQEKTGWSRRQIIRAEKIFGRKPGK